MKKNLFVIALLFGAFAFEPQPAVAYAQTEDEIEKMYEQYITPEVQAIRDRFDQMEQRDAEIRAANQMRMNIALVISILVGLIPFFWILVKSFKTGSWKVNPGGTVWGLVIALAGGVLLFAINYGIFWLRFKYNDEFNAVLTYGLVLALIIGVIYLLNKKG
ncbi:MAG: hypothetical protein J6X77_01305 [Bacteroidales bacterium]|nr:hypothetical protein [Bacteroidales bacterium]